MRRIKFVVSTVLGLTLTLQHYATHAQSFPDVYVYGEDDSSDNTACSASHLSAIATVQAALRNNKIKVINNDEEISYMQAYVNITAVKLRDLCAVQLSLNFQNFQMIEDEYSKKRFFATITYCDKGGVYTGGPSYIYSNLLNAYRDMTNICISEYYKIVSK